MELLFHFMCLSDWYRLRSNLYTRGLLSIDLISGLPGCGVSQLFFLIIIGIMIIIMIGQMNGTIPINAPLNKDIPSSGRMNKSAIGSPQHSAIIHMWDIGPLCFMLFPCTWSDALSGPLFPLSLLLQQFIWLNSLKVFCFWYIYITLVWRFYGENNSL